MVSRRQDAALVVQQWRVLCVCLCGESFFFAYLSRRQFPIVTNSCVLPVTTVSRVSLFCCLVHLKVDQSVGSTASLACN